MAWNNLTTDLSEVTLPVPADKERRECSADYRYYLNYCTNCMVNWHKKQLKMWVIQCAGGGQPWQKEVDKATEKFFAQPFDSSEVNAYTGRTK